MLHTVFCVCQKKFFLCTGDANVAKAAFFLNFLFPAVHDSAVAGENAFFHADDEYIGEFQSLRAVQRHQGDCLLAFLVAVNICNECDFFQKARQCVFLLGVSLIVFHSLIHKFVDVLNTANGFICPFVQQKLQISCPLYNCVNQFTDFQPARVSPQAFKQIVEFAEFCRTCFQLCDFVQMLQSFIKRTVVPFRKRRNLIQRGFADASARNIDNTPQGNGVRRIREYLQVRKDIPDFLSLVKTYAAKQPVGDAALDKLVLYCAGLVIRAVKHGKLIPCFALRRHFLYFFCHKTAFVIFVICFINMQYTAAVILSPKRFVLAGLVIVDNGVCGFQNFFCGTVILLQLDYDRAGEILFKIKDIADVRAAPAVNALVIVPHNTKILVFCRQKPHQFILAGICILIFIYHNIAEAFLIFVQHIGAITEQ